MRGPRWSPPPHAPRRAPSADLLVGAPLLGVGHLRSSPRKNTACSCNWRVRARSMSLLNSNWPNRIALFASWTAASRRRSLMTRAFAIVNSASLRTPSRRSLPSFSSSAATPTVEGRMPGINIAPPTPRIRSASSVSTADDGSPSFSPSQYLVSGAGRLALAIAASVAARLKAARGGGLLLP